MFAALLQGLLLGFGACIPIGPINILIMNYALRSYKDAVVFGMGAMSADIMYLILITYGLLQFLKESVLLDVIALLGTVFLLYLSWGVFKNRHRHITTQQVKQSKTFLLYIKGFTLTALNPYTIGFWLSVSVLAGHAGHYTYVVLAGLILAIFSWITLMPLSVYKSRHLISDTLLTYFSLFSALILAGFALMLFYLSLVQ